MLVRSIYMYTGKFDPEFPSVAKAMLITIAT